MDDAERDELMAEVERLFGLASSAMARASAAERERNDLAAKVAAVLALHRPWYTIHGVRHDHTVMANCEDYAGCDGTADTDCDAAGEHERLACVECRHVFEDMDGNLFWPCPTARALGIGDPS